MLHYKAWAVNQLELVSGAWTDFNDCHHELTSVKSSNQDRLQQHRVNVSHRRRFCESWKEKSLDDLRRDEKRPEDMQRDENRCDQLRRAETGQKTWDDRWDEMTCDDRWHELTYDEMRRDWVQKTLRRHNVRWDEIRENKLRWQWHTSDFQDKLRCQEIKRHESRSTIRKTWRRNDKSRDCCCKTHKACLHPIGTVLVPLHRL